jgi:mono/diheme cytochrome c family protein
MRRLFVFVIALVVFGAPLALGLTAPERVPEAALGAHSPDLQNGRRMFFAGGCASCHATPGQDDPLRLGGGRELRSSFGTFRVPNLSPHPKDGIGGWTERQFVSAMLKGTSPGGEHYYPAFPYTSYQRMRVADVRDLFAFLKSLPAVEGGQPGHTLPFPFNLRTGIGLWKLRYLDGKPFRSDPQRDQAWNRGAYLVEGPGHCAECHSPRDLAGGIVTAQRLAGGPNPTGEGSVPNITQHVRGLASWSENDIARLLETGEKPDFDAVSGDMRAVVRNTAQLSPEDRRAMAHYLKSLPAIVGPSGQN